MTVFWSVVALLLGGALLMLLPPLWRSRATAEAVTRGAANLAVYRDQWREAEADLGQGLLAPDQIEPVREDIQRRWLEDAAAGAAPPMGPALPAASTAARRSAIALGLLLPLASVLTYLALGNQASLAPVPPPPAAPAAGEARHTLAPQRAGYFQVVRGSFTLNGQALAEGDGAALPEGGLLTVVAEGAAEALLFDLPEVRRG